MLVWSIRVPLALLLIALLVLSGCATTDGPTDTADATSKPENTVKALHLRTLGEVLPELLSARAVVVGEQHDRLDHHVLQLDVIRYLYSVNPRLAIGLEFFDQSVQSALDDYIAGAIDERTMLLNTGYFNNWRFDYRLYAPVLRFAREHGIPLIALNVPGDVSRQIALEGLASLNDAQRAYVPAELDRDVEGYAERIRESFAAHAHTPLQDLDRFIDAQLVWDEAMAEVAATYLEQNPADQMVILAGIGHVIYGSGIPTRLERRIGPPVLTVIPMEKDQVGENPMADYLVETDTLTLPGKPVLGLMLNSDDEPGLLVNEVVGGSAAERAGVLAGDRLQAIDGLAVTGFAELAVQMWDKSAGDQVELVVERSEIEGDRRVGLMLKL